MRNIILLCILFVYQTFASTVEVKLTSGKTFKGTVVSENERYLVLNIDGSNISISKNLIVAVDNMPYAPEASHQNTGDAASTGQKGNTAPATAVPAYTPSPGAAAVIQMKNGLIHRGIVAQETKLYFLLNANGKDIYCYKSGIYKMFANEEDMRRSDADMHRTDNTGTYQNDAVTEADTMTKKDTGPDYIYNDKRGEFTVETSETPATGSANASEYFKKLKKDRINSPYIYVNFCSGGLNVCNISKEYSNLLANYYGLILYNMLDSMFTVAPESKLLASGNCFVTLGFYPKSFFGINIGFGYMVKGDKVLLIEEGSEEVNEVLKVKYLEFPVFLRLMTPDNIAAGYLDIGFSYGRAVAGNEKMVYEYDGPGQDDYESEDWQNADLFDDLNKAYYSKDSYSFIAGIGVHAFCIFVDYRVFIGLTDLSNNDNPDNVKIESKFFTHTLNIGFDYYFKLRR